MAVTGYVRLGRDELDGQAQHDMVVLGVDRVYQDRHRQRSQPGLKAALAALKVGDVIVVARLSQLGLGAGGLLRLVAALRERGCHLAALQENLDTRRQIDWQFFAYSRLLLAMEKELSRSHSADAELITIGPARGRRGGRKPKLSPAKVEEIRQELWRRTNRYTVKDIAKRFGISKQTLYTRVLNTPDPGIL